MQTSATVISLLLFAVATAAKELVVFDEGRHSDLDRHGAVEAVVAWIGRLDRHR